MPLESNLKQQPFAYETTVRWSMIEAGTTNVVPCRISDEALQDHFGAGDHLEAFLGSQMTIEDAASEKFDRTQPRPEFVLLVTADF